MARKVLGWIIFVLIAAFIGFIIWLFFFREEPDLTQFEVRERPEDFFPIDAQSNIGDNGVINQDGRSEADSGRGLIPRVRQLSKVPTAGGIAFERLTGSSQTFITEDGVEETSTSSVTIFRYVERATGHLYETRENTLTQTRLSNTTVPKVRDAKFAPDGQHVVLRLVDEDDNETVRTIAATVVPKSTSSPESFRLVADGYALDGPFLAPNVESIAIAPYGITYAVPNSDRGSAIITADFNDLAKDLLYDAPLREWVLKWINEDTITLTTKADSRVPGYLYFIDTNRRTLEKKIGDVLGLTTLTSPDEKWIIYSESRNNTLETYALNQETGDVAVLGINTLPEKCVFAKTDENIVYCAASNQPDRAPYPESWYQGLVSFEDNLWKIYLETDEYELLLGDGEEVGESFDMTKLTISPKDEYVLFVNKKDLTLWSVDVTRVDRN